MINNEPILSICIPIYNRADYLIRHFNQCLKYKELFDEKVQLFISDNCSDQNLRIVVEEYHQKGLCFEYSRNETNIGPDANFIKCFNSAKGKYLWLLGSDDIPIDGFIPKLVEILESHNYSYLFLNHMNNNGTLTEYGSASGILEEIHVWITFMSANIFRTEYVKNVHGEEYMNTYLIQVPYFLEGIVANDNKAIYNCSWIQKGSDSANNGGYDFFKVFVDNLLSILYEKVISKQIDINTYNRVKKSLFCKYIVFNVYDILIIRNSNKTAHFQTKDAWGILLKHYSTKPYFYFSIIRTIVSRLYHQVHH